MAISTSPVQEKISNAWTSGPSFTITGFSAPTNGNLLVIYYSASTTTMSITSISQTGATWAKAVSSNTLRRAEVWYAENVSGAATSITINLNSTPASAGNQSASLSEWSGPTTSVLDTAVGGNSGTSVTTTSATITPTAGRNALMICGARVGGAVSAGPAGGFTALANADSGVRSYGAYRVESATSGTYATNWTNASGNWETAIATFLAPASGVKPAPAALFQFTHR